MSITTFFGNLGRSAVELGQRIGDSITEPFQVTTPPFIPAPSAENYNINVPTQTKTSIPIPQRKPQIPTTSQSGGGITGFLNNAGTLFGQVGQIAETGVKTFFGVKSQIEQFKTAQELEDIKLKAVRQSAEQAPPAAQVLLPSFSDFVNDPREAASQVVPAALAGSGAISAGSNILSFGGLAAAAYFLTRR